jgi:hypothetical protein
MINIFMTSKKQNKNYLKKQNQLKTKNQLELIFFFSRTLKVKKTHNKNFPCQKE